MNRTRRLNDDDDDGSNEAELQRLQRLYRMEDGQRKQYTEQSQQTIRKQKETIAKLKKDHDFLLGELKQAEGGAAAAKKEGQRGLELQAQIEAYQAEIAEERVQLSNLDAELKTLNATVMQKRKLAQAASSAVAGKGNLERQVHTLENRLEKTLKTFNQSLTKNKKLRDKLDNLKKERKVFEALYKKLEKRINGQKRKMAALIEQSNQAYETRDEAQNKMALLKEKNEKEMAQYAMEIKELTRVLEHDKKLKSFMGVKGQDRSKEAPLHLTSRRAAADSAQEKPTAETYEAAFAKIKETTGIQDVDKLVATFIQVEDTNFSIFNYVNELNNEIEVLQEKSVDIRRDIERFNKEGEALDKHRKHHLKGLEDTLSATQQRASGNQEKHQQAQSVLDTLKAAIKRIFDKIDCDQSALAGMLGDTGVTDANLMQYLGLIEQRTNELLHLQTLLETNEHSKWEQQEAELRERAVVDGENIDLRATLGPKPTVSSVMGTGPQPKRAAPISILPPSTLTDLDGGDDDDDHSRPLSHDELKAKIMRGIQNKETPA